MGKQMLECTIGVSWNWNISSYLTRWVETFLKKWICQFATVLTRTFHWSLIGKMQIMLLCITKDFFELLMNLVHWVRNYIKKLAIAFHPDSYNLLRRSPNILIHCSRPHGFQNFWLHICQIKNFDTVILFPETMSDIYPNFTQLVDVT